MLIGSRPRVVMRSMFWPYPVFGPYPGFCALNRHASRCDGRCARTDRGCHPRCAPLPVGHILIFESLQQPAPFEAAICRRMRPDALQFEAWLARSIKHVYHQRVHRAWASRVGVGLRGTMLRGQRERVLAGSDLYVDYRAESPTVCSMSLRNCCSLLGSTKRLPLMRIASRPIGH